LLDSVLHTGGLRQTEYNRNSSNILKISYYKDTEILKHCLNKVFLILLKHHI